MRYAGDLFAAFGEQLREQQLSANRSQPIGAGTFGSVYESDTPGNVMKQLHPSWNGMGGDLVEEANLQAVAAELGLAPKVAGIETFRGGIGDRVEMQDVRNNFEARAFGDKFPVGMDAVRVNQQLGQLALKGIRLEDRHNGNIRYNKMTGRPIQLDFGVAGKVSGSEQVATLTMATADGLQAAGLGDVASIYRATVMDLLEGGDVKDAMDVAKQGFSRLQKIKQPLEGVAIKSNRQPPDVVSWL